jgi:hypothetical protein
LILVILGVMWVLVLLPPFLRSIREGRPSDSVGSFRRQLTVLERATPGTYRGPSTMAPVAGLAPRTSSAAARRRRQAERRRMVFTGIAVVAVLSGVLGLFTGTRLLLAVGGASFLVLAGFTWLAIQQQGAAASAPAPRRVSRWRPAEDDLFAGYR